MNPARRTTATAAFATTIVLATAGALLSTAATAASAATTCDSPVYKRQFFANTTFSGTPKKTDCDTTIAENWGAKAPATGLPKNYFGVRWTVTRDFGSGGPFAFAAAAQDGIRVYVDGKVKVNLWKNVTTTRNKTVNLTVPKGRHTLRVDYANFTGNANVKFTYAPRTLASVDNVKPLPPTGANASYSASADTVKIAWAKNAEMDLSGYRVYQRPPNSTAWTRVSGDTELAGTSFTMGIPPLGRTTYFEVRAVDKVGNESVGSTDVMVSSADRTPPAVPKPVVVYDSHLDGVVLHWDAPEVGIKFTLSRSAPSTGELTWQTNFAHNWTDVSAPFGETSYYQVTATDAYGNTSVSAVLPHTRELAVPNLPLVEHWPEDGSGIPLTWWMSPYAPTEFRVHREEQLFDEATSSYVTVDSRVVPCAPTLFYVGPRNGYTCTDTTAVLSPANRIYVYWVTSVDPLGRESDPSARRQFTYRDGTQPASGDTSAAPAPQAE
ncbi:PA14 domain-containing protein [Streptomyces sp. AK08-02]|uniref:PA14 domain-containing protein n=1 Tax=Streptomyces sp. AK08-02 TaxID=3028654 RepID=UPI0029A84643|nr:PA14 domain-containing protein [Streptomyces sp. AK08-02]MDX3752752.1 PA14 domain-containing protein [Streptomyces sp. AK08-02]